MILEENAFDFSISSSRGARYRLSTDKAAAAMASETVQTSLNWLQPLKKLRFFFQNVILKEKKILGSIKQLSVSQHVMQRSQKLVLLLRVLSHQTAGGPGYFSWWDGGFTRLTGDVVVTDILTVDLLTHLQTCAGMSVLLHICTVSFATHE